MGFILVRKVFRKAFRILGLDETKGRRVVEQDFHGNFQVNVTWLFAFFSGVLDWIVLMLVRSLHFAHVSGQSCPWPLKLMTSPAVKGTWICMGGSGANRLTKALQYRVFPQLLNYELSSINTLDHSAINLPKTSSQIWCSRPEENLCQIICTTAREKK